MTARAGDIVRAFHRAAAELGFRFTAPYDLDPGDGNTRRYLGLVHAFGAPRGTILDLAHGGVGPPPGVSELGYFYSAVSDSYSTFDPRLFRETLDDWQFFGPDSERPRWYTGQSWS